MLSTRPYQPNDFDYVNDMIKSNMRPYFELYDIKWEEDDTFLKSLDKGIREIIRYDDVDCGFYHLVTDGGCGKLNIIQIHKAYQGKGIGTSMIKQIEEDLIKQDLHLIRLTVFRANPAYKLYVKMGYEIENETPVKFRMIKKI